MLFHRLTVSFPLSTFTDWNDLRVSSVAAITLKYLCEYVGVGVCACVCVCL